MAFLWQCVHNGYNLVFNHSIPLWLAPVFGQLLFLFFGLKKKKKFKTSREWRKVDQRVYFHLSAHSLRVLASTVAEGGHILPKDYFRLCAQVPSCCFHCLLGASQDVGTNQTERCSLNQDLNELLVAFTHLQVIPVIATAVGFLQAGALRPRSNGLLFCNRRTKS